ncbi:hypothetical protein [Pseudobutyrivibrio sp.]|uniref:hypothetical protein n=1 Tax=Pseudobutyrivibrio sp. TaxID=2014367 RepID=UPI001E07C183|nr:hypothetical protein [Pseudobutyrivibrio sp.]MBE5912369.1 hypothetical protein [Pseudobutyrivibrio sp.]
MIKSDSIYNLNKNASNLALNSNHDRNYIHLFRPHNNNKLNIIGSFKESIDLEHTDYTESDNLSSSTPSSTDILSAFSKNSFGIIANRDFPDFRDISLDIYGNDKNFYKSIDAFEKELNNAVNNFCIDRSNPNASGTKPAGYSYAYEQYQKALYARCLIAAIWCFGIELNDNNAIFKSELEASKEVFVVSNEDKGTFTIFGRPSDSLITKLAYVDCTITSNSTTMPFSQIYKKDNQKLLKSSNPSLYSGVLPRLVSIKTAEPSTGNNTVEKMTLSLGRTSYMTIMGLHFTSGGTYQSSLLDHPYLINIMLNGVSLSEINKDFDRQESFLQHKLVETLNSNISYEDEVKALNDYLSKSFNVHNVNISGNVITGDSYCLFTKRADKMTDKNQYYCSVNGGSEIIDTSVRYYKNSNLEDIPTIDYSDAPFYFGSELTRESIAELGDTDTSPYWTYYGLTCMSHLTDSYETDSNCLWMHFNVLGEKTSPYTLEQINTMRSSASEKFESKSLHGYSITQYRTRHEYAISRLVKYTQFLQDISDIIIAVIIAIQLIINHHFTDSIANTAFSFALAIVALILIIKSCIDLHKKSKIYSNFIIKTYNHFNIKLYKCDYTNEFNNSFQHKLNANNELDSIFYVLTNMHLLTMIKDKEDD